ncbi:MAG: helix-turn-helix domain-containing protein [Planctomycetia bacterium]|nr:helix-turn-helix domain-containing protein [Planctomycetia bacterium]
MGKLRLSVKERERSEVLLKVSQSSISLSKASELLGVSYRQVLRIWKRYQSAGVSGWKHGLRDRASNRRFDVGRRERGLELYRAKYGDFGPTLAVEYLVKCDGETLSEETLRQWLIGAGMWSPRRRGAPHRQWRERREHWGELVQMDGSDHDWFEGRRGKASMMVMIDDATNWTHAKFFESETTAAAMTVFACNRSTHWSRRIRTWRAKYLDELNEQFHVVARSSVNLHRSLPCGLNLNHVLCYQEPRVVQNDKTVSWHNRIFQLGPEHQTLSFGADRRSW